jgi:hypothetical protein
MPNARINRAGNIERPFKFSMTSELLLIMNQRDRIALVTGVLLGVGSCFLISFSGMAAGAALLVTLLICPLITSMLASERLFLAGLVPNILIAAGGSIFGASSPYNRTAWDIWPIILSMFALGIVFALVMAGAVWVVRKKIM